jgi:MerR family redox-sensitive transcriptional activator SoxR
MDATLTIGEVARRAGLRASTIRYYESLGVLPEPAREAGRRRYTEDVVRRLEVIAVAKRAGFTLDEARALLASDAPSDELRALAERKLPEVDALIARTRAMRQWLAVAAECGCASLDDCPLF